MSRQRGLMRYVLALTVMTGFLPVAAQEARQAQDPWVRRARTITDDLVKDSEALTRFDRALLLASLGSVWRKDDAESARKWTEKAIREVESASEKESPSERRQRLATAGTLLKLSGVQDEMLTARLLKVLADDTVNNASEEQRENAKSLVEMAQTLVEADPRRAAELGSAALRAGGNYKLAGLLWRLRKRDAKLGDSLFIEILTAARTRGYDPGLLSLLPSVAFEGPEPSDLLRAKLLGTLAEGLLHPSGSVADEAAVCKLAPISAPLLPEFQRLIPQQASAIRYVVTKCQPQLDSTSRKDVNDTLRDQPLNTVEELLKAAKESSDLERRITYLYRAASMAGERQEFDRAILILDGFTDGERELMSKLMNGLWESARASFALAAASSYLRRGEHDRMRRVIVSTPVSLLAFVQIGVASELMKKGDRAAAIELFDEGRLNLTKADQGQAVGSYIELVRQYAAFDAFKALSVLRDATSAINRSDSGQEEKSSSDFETPLLSSDMLMTPYSLPASLLEVDEQGVREAISSINSPVKRAAVRLRLLSTSLSRRRPAPQATLTGGV